ncbi:MAG: hypothetical protein EOO60_12620, partial [Hymenobacter sp.]
MLVRVDETGSWFLTYALPFVTFPLAAVNAAPLVLTLPPMRLFALLFSLYLTCLSCLPCADDVPVRGEQTQMTISARSHSDGGHNMGDWCSPLCQCHCCAGAVFTLLGTTSLAFPRPIQWATGSRHA